MRRLFRRGGAHASPGLLALLAPVTAAGLAVVVAAAASFATGAHTWTCAAGIAVLLAAAVFAEAFPVPMESLPAGYVSLAAVFVVGTAVLYGWDGAIFVAMLTRVLLEIVQRRPVVKLVYNGSVYALGGGAAGLAAAVAPDVLLAKVALAAAAFYVVNVVLVAAVIARWAGQRFFVLLSQSAYLTAVPFAIMASVSLMLVVLWQDSPVYAGALFGPLVAVALYQRSVHSALKAMRLALTDQLTGLGNNRHFTERLEGDLDRADAGAYPLALCLIDVDDFKQINDRYGHTVGDQVLAQVASGLRHGGEAFRIGGDEFALLLPARDQLTAVTIAEAVVKRLGEIEYVHGERVRFSVGVIAYPQHGIERWELVRLADVALYWAKGEGKNRIRAYSPAAPALRQARVTSAPIAQAS
jgi:diguanylate cyclase (GGDEF)-like protein